MKKFTVLLLSFSTEIKMNAHHVTLGVVNYEAVLPVNDSKLVKVYPEPLKHVDHYKQKALPDRSKKLFTRLRSLKW
jgi:hypothetical protein